MFFLSTLAGVKNLLGDLVVVKWVAVRTGLETCALV